jgi:outer membrane receptor protein involved in Fe transport
LKAVTDQTECDEIEAREFHAETEVQLLPVNAFEKRAPGERAMNSALLGCARWSAFVTLSLAAGAAFTQTLPEVNVIGTTPLPGLGQAKEEIPSAVQSATTRDLERSGTSDLSSFMNRNLGSVHINENQGNPFQADINYRGYTASPLLGTPQGLSVYLDGVRLNQPFGDVVSWDLIPRFAISSVTLMPGSNPLFGLNTLGGAIALQTKDGKRFPGTSANLSLGAFGRRSLELEHGGFNKENGLNWYVGTQLYKERGWRDHSPSDVRQVFGKLGWANAATDIKLTLALADNELNGNGLQEFRSLDSQYSSVYTKPDITKNRSLYLNLTGLHSLSEQATLSGNLYYRNIRSSTFNGDLNGSSLNQEVYQPNAAERAALTAAGYSGFPGAGANAGNTPFPYWRCVANVLLNDEPAEKCNGLINTTSLKQSNWGLSSQLALEGKLAGHRNQFTIGLGYDASRLKFTQATQLGYINPDRSIIGLPAFADGGLTGGVVDDQPFDNRVDLEGSVRTYSIYAMNSLSIANTWHVTASGRFNHTRLRNRDILNPGGGLNSLDGDHSFSRFNPALGLSFVASKQLNAYLGYSEGSRAPTSVELGCANPENPCKLPNALAGDPPLEQVVTKTWEAGLRGRVGQNMQWSAGLFRAENFNDLLFVADNTSGFGYFKNFGKTLRQGLELGLGGRSGPWAFGTHYTYLSATYQSPETVLGAGNSSNSSAVAGTPGVDGTINIKPGDQIPLVPKHLFKIHADYQWSPEWSFGGNMNAVSGVFARGNENNQHQASAPYYLGAGKTGGYAVVNLQARYQPSKRWQVFAHINNVFDRRFVTSAQLGAMGFSSKGNFQSRPLGANANGDYPLQNSTFLAPGAPRSFWVGVKAQW